MYHTPTVKQCTVQPCLYFIFLGGCLLSLSYNILHSTHTLSEHTRTLREPDIYIHTTQLLLA